MLFSNIAFFISQSAKEMLFSSFFLQVFEKNSWIPFIVFISYSVKTNKWLTFKAARMATVYFCKTFRAIGGRRKIHIALSLKYHERRNENKNGQKFCHLSYQHRWFCYWDHLKKIKRKIIFYWTQISIGSKRKNRFRLVLRYTKNVSNVQHVDEREPINYND